MALISCPNCGKEISDKAIKCPQCGYMLNEPTIDKQQNNVCEECGTVFPLESTSCPNCGCPVAQPKSTKKKSPAGTLLLLVGVILAAVFGFKQYQSIQRTNFHINYYNAVNAMADGGEKAETDAFLIRGVWANAINKKSDPKTDKFTKQNNGTGAFYSDFNDALKALFADEDFKNDLSFIYDNQLEVDSYMKKLKKHSDRFSEEYDAIKKLHESYMKLTNMVLNPLGSCQSYAEDLNAVFKETTDNYRAVALYLDDE